jgi:tetrathionate reductase subunit B
MSDSSSSSFPSPTAAMYVNLKRCIGCNSCSLACKQEFNVRVGELWNQVWGAESGSYPAVGVQVLPLRCQQCANAPCISTCNNLGYKAIKRRADGIVWIDATACVGCQRCVPACPYKAMNFNTQRKNKLGKLGVAEKCEFCRQRLDAGLLPACVITCLGITLEYGDYNALRAKYPNADHMGEGEDGLKILYDNLGGEPKRPTNGYPNPVPFHD